MQEERKIARLQVIIRLEMLGSQTDRQTISMSERERTLTHT